MEFLGNCFEGVLLREKFLCGYGDRRGKHHCICLRHNKQKSSKKNRKTVEFGLETGQTYTMCLTCRSVQKNNHKNKMITAR